MRFWAKSRLVFNSFRNPAKVSIRQVADQTGLSKSSVHRLKQAMARRDRHPESWFWETEAGHRWLLRLVVATLYLFGLKRGVGAETLSEFFTRLHLATHVGCSPSALRGVMAELERVILETVATWEDEGIKAGASPPIIGAVDETFLQRLMLVFMDLSSGYLVVEEVAEDRTYDTWSALVEARLEALGTKVRYLVSDRAQALIKLAETGLGCLSIPDLFHLLHDLVKSYSLAIHRQLHQARQVLSQAQDRLDKCEGSTPGDAQAHQAQAEVAASTAEVARWERIRSAYRLHLESMSLMVHPWRVADGARQSSAEVERQLQVEIEALERLIETTGLPVKKKALDKVRKQVSGLAALVDFWWLGVRQDLQQLAMTPKWTSWVEERLLPLMYWQRQVSRTRCVRRKAQLLQRLEVVQGEFETDPFTAQLAPEVRESWTAWAAEQAGAFQRASSALEGRNGYLSQMHHNQRGLPKRRYQVWTALHNFDCRASDGTTPASRFFRRSFPDLFEAVLSQIDDLPRSRERKQVMASST